MIVSFYFYSTVCSILTTEAPNVFKLIAFHFAGLDAIYHLTRTNRKLSIYLEAHDGESRTANYSTFYIDDGDTEYVNHVRVSRFVYACSMFLNPCKRWRIDISQSIIHAFQNKLSELCMYTANLQLMNRHTFTNTI